MDLDPDKLVNSMGDAAIQAEILKKFKEENPTPEAPAEAPQSAAPEGAPPAGVQVQDTQGSGGGQIGTGSVPTPGEQGFTANTGQPPIQ